MCVCVCVCVCVNIQRGLSDSADPAGPLLTPLGKENWLEKLVRCGNFQPWKAARSFASDLVLILNCVSLLCFQILHAPCAM